MTKIYLYLHTKKTKFITINSAHKKRTMTHNALQTLIGIQVTGFSDTFHDAGELDEILKRSDIGKVLRKGLCSKDVLCEKGASYLDMALRYKAPTALLDALVEACHEQVDGLFIKAIRCGAPEAVLMNMFRARPSAAEECDMVDGWPALLFAIQRRMFALAAALLTSYPAAARVRRRGSSVLLHVLSHRTIPRPWMAGTLFIRLLMQLLDVWQDAANCCDLKGIFPLARALQITVAGDVALYPVGSGRSMACEGRVALVLRLIDISPSSVRKMCTLSGHRMSMLMLACSSWALPWPNCVLHALIQASPETVAWQCGVYSNTPLHVTAGTARCGGPDKLPVLKAMLAACPEALGVRNINGHYPLHHALKYAYPADVKLALLAADPSIAREDGSVYSALSEVLHTTDRGCDLDPRDNAVICAVFDAAWRGGAATIDKREVHGSLVRVLSRPYGRSPPDDKGMCDVARRMIAAIMNNGDSRRQAEMAMGALALSTLARAGMYFLLSGTVLSSLSSRVLPLEMVVAVIEASGKRIAHERATDGSTALHYVVTFAASKDAPATTVNVLCRLLLRLGVCPTTVNRDGLTAVDAATECVGRPNITPDVHDNMLCALSHMHYTLHEYSKYAEGPRDHPNPNFKFSCLHRQHWSTIMHQHCAPSAKLNVLVVLLAGVTYRRKLLPRLPMDCYYRILYNLDRSQLRVGACCGINEEAARATYASILNAAKSK